MTGIDNCPFCGGNARVTAREYKFGGYNGLGQARRKYLVRVMCNRCHAYGPAFNTSWVKTTWAEWKHGRKEEFGDNAAFDWAEKSAIEQWNGSKRQAFKSFKRWLECAGMDHVISAMETDL